MDSALLALVCGFRHSLETMVRPITQPQNQLRDTVAAALAASGCPNVRGVAQSITEAILRDFLVVSALADGPPIPPPPTSWSYGAGSQ